MIIFFQTSRFFKRLLVCSFGFLFYFSGSLTSQSVSNLVETHQTTTNGGLSHASNIGKEKPRKKTLWDRLSFEADLLFYYRNSALFEITGNEQTFVTSFRPKLLFRESLGPVDFLATVDFFLTESLSPKGRLFENMNPPQILPNQMDLQIRLGKHHRFTMGLVKPLHWQLPMEVFSIPVMYKTSPYPNGALLPYTLVLGFRDVPIPYAGLTPWYDTGIFYELSLGYFRAALGFANGEEGLDANSSKNGAVSLGLETPHFKTSLVADMGEYGSVPIKEWRHYYKFLFYAGQKNKIGAEALLVFHGIKNHSILATNLEANGKTYLQNHFGYDDGFFNPYSIAANSAITYPLGIDPKGVFSFSSFFYFDLRPTFPVVQDRFQLTGHAGLYIPDLARTGGDELKPKYRTFLRLIFHITPFFRAIISDTFTYDPLFLNRNIDQFYDKESRAEHPLADNDIFIGFDVTLK